MPAKTAKKVENHSKEGPNKATVGKSQGKDIITSTLFDELDYQKINHVNTTSKSFFMHQFLYSNTSFPIFF